MVQRVGERSSARCSLHRPVPATPEGAPAVLDGSPARCRSRSPRRRAVVGEGRARHGYRIRARLIIAPEHVAQGVPRGTSEETRLLREREGSSGGVRAAAALARMHAAGNCSASAGPGRGRGLVLGARSRPRIAHGFLFFSPGGGLPSRGSSHLERVLVTPLPVVECSLRRSLQGPVVTS